MGFGQHAKRVREPRAAVLTTAAEHFYEMGGDDGFLETANEVERTAVDLLAVHNAARRLTNVEFYTATLLHGIGAP